MTELEQEKIISKIQKLLAFTGENANTTPEEAATAAAKVQELLQKYNLDRSMLTSSTQKSSLIMIDVELPTSRLWAKRLLNTLASYNFCKALWVTGTDKGILVGEQVNTEVVTSLFNYLSDQLPIMAVTAYKNYTATSKLFRNNYPISPQSYKTNFYTGAIDAIHHRLDKQQRAFAAQSNVSKALMVVNDRDIKEFIEEQFPTTKQVNTRKQSSKGTQGYQSGIQAGLSIDLQQKKAIEA